MQETQKELAYKVVEKEIRKRITGKKYKPGHKLPTERDLAKEFSISRLTIAKGLSNLAAAGYITRTRGRGSFVCPELPAEATSRRSNSDGIIKYISPGFTGQSSPVSYGILEGIHSMMTAARSHIGVEFYTTVKEQLKMLETYRSEINDGMVIWPAMDKSLVPILQQMQDDNFPFVLVDMYIPEFKCDYIISDNCLGSEIMINYLVDNGHRNISYFTATPDRVSLSERMSGVVSGLSKHGLPVTSNTINVIPGDDKVVNSYRSSQNIAYLRNRLAELLNSSNAPTAIYCSNDWIAMTIYSILEEMGVKVPEQVSLAGYDNIDAAQYFRVPLTTVSQNFFEMGQLAAKVLISRRQNPVSHEGMMMQQRVKPELVIRDSVTKLI